MSPKKALLAVTVACLLLLTSGCLSDDGEEEDMVAIEVLLETEQNVVQGNNTTFVLLVENNYKENHTLKMGLEDLPDDWSSDFLPEEVVLAKNNDTTVRLNLSVPETSEERGHRMRVSVRAEGTDHEDSEVITVFVLTGATSTDLEVVDPGETAYVNYTGFLEDGKIFDSNDEDVATRGNVYDDFSPRSVYDPSPFHAGRGELVEGFERAFQGMRQGEYKSFFVPEDEAYSDHQEVTINLTDTAPLREDWTDTDFSRAFRQDAAMWLTVTHRKYNWTAQVVAIDDETGTVTIELQVEPGDTTEAWGWETEVVSVDSSANGGVGEIVLRHDPEADGEAKLYNSTAPDEFDFGNITELTDDTVTVRVQRSHHPLAGHDLVFLVKIDSIEPA